MSNQDENQRRLRGGRMSGDFGNWKPGSDQRPFFRDVWKVLRRNFVWGLIGGFISFKGEKHPS